MIAFNKALFGPSFARNHQQLLATNCASSYRTSGCNENDTVRDLRIAMCDLKPTATDSRLSVQVSIKTDAEERVSAEMTVQEIAQLIPDRDTGFCWEDLAERDHLQYVSVHGRIILKCAFKKWDGEAWTGLLWLRIGTSGRRL
jgi:hypothetical protein